MDKMAKFRCPACGCRVKFSYAHSIADGKRYVCSKCGEHLVPQTGNIIYARVAAVALTLLLALVYHFVAFNKMGLEQTLVNQAIMFIVVIASYLGLLYLLVVRRVVMRRLNG